MNTILTDAEVDALWPAPEGTNSIQTIIRIAEAAVLAKLAAQEPVAWVVCSINKDGSPSLEYAAAWKEAAHEHINDAITEHEIEDAASWVVRPVYAAPQPAVMQNIHPDDLKWLERQPLRDCGDRLVYDTEDVDSATHALTGDEGEDDSVTLLRRLAKAIEQRQPGKSVWDLLDALDEQPAVVQVPQGYKLVPVEPTKEMCKAAVIYANGNAVYKNVPAAALEIEEGIYGEAYAAMLAAAPEAPAQADPGTYHAWAGDITDEAILRRAVSVMDDVLTDIGDWEDKALAEAVESCRVELLAMADGIAMVGGEAPAQADNLTTELQQRCSDWGVYWRAPDAHGVVLTVEQAAELLRDALGVEVEIKSPAHPIPPQWREAMKVARTTLEDWLNDYGDCAEGGEADELVQFTRAALAQLDALGGGE